MSVRDCAVGERVKLWNQYATPLIDTYTESIYVPQSRNGTRKITVSYNWNVSPTSNTITIQRSDDEVTWTTVGTFTNARQDMAVYNVSGYVRAYMTAITIGSGSGLDLSILIGTDLRVDDYSSSLAAAQVDFLPLLFDTSGTGAGDVKGVSVELEASGVLHSYQTAIFAKLHGTAAGKLKNPCSITGDMKFDASCWVEGLSYGIGTYIELPGAAVVAGTLTGVYVELNAPTSFTHGATSISFFRVAASGNATAIQSLEDRAFLFDISGLNEGTGNLFSAGADVAAAATLRIRVGSTSYYLLLGAGEST